MRIVRFLLIAIWLGLVGVLVHEQLGPFGSATAPASDPPVENAEAVAQDTWMGVYMQGRKIGYTHHRQVPNDDGYRLEEESVLRLTVLDTVQTVRTRIDAEVDPEHALRSFSVSLKSGVGDLVARGTVEDGSVDLTMEAGGQTDRRSFPLREPLFLPGTVRSSFSQGELEPGRERSFQVFDPSAMQNQPLRARVEEKETLEIRGRKIEAWRVRESFRGIEAVVWYDEQGRVVREEGPMGLAAVAEPRAEAVAGGWNEGDAFDLMAAVAVRVATPIEAPRERDRLRLRLAGIGDFAVPSDARQAYRDGLLTIDRERPGEHGTFELPYRGQEWAPDLAATAFLQVDNPAVRNASTEILVGERDARRAAERLRRWVYTRVEKRPLASIPNAVQVLDTMSGDCNEHAVLFAALARAAGLPARVVAGAVYMDGVFLYHAWNEVWLGTGWVTVDPTFDQMPADATHVKLLEGGPERHADLLSIIGRLEIEVVPSDLEADATG
jgi:transglutaminase-like putative cysteine protease